MILIEEKNNNTASRLKQITAAMPNKPSCYIRTFGCQQNVSDSERIAGMMSQCGYNIADSPDTADLIIFNTCAVREHAEDRVFGNVGELKRLKEANKSLIVALGGCMVQQAHIAEKLRSSYLFVDVIFNTNELHRLPGHIADAVEKGNPVVAIDCADYTIHEGLPVMRDRECRAFIPIMYGCDNFCSYCVVPLVRGRERSRESADILSEFRQVVADGYKDITLLGQNVNSYGKKLDADINFAGLLHMLCKEDGDFTIRFMTSHPKDATHELLDTIAANSRISRHIHLPVQSGSDTILRRMNRGYTAAQYMELIDCARKKIDGVTFSSDIIVGFPGETEQDYADTLELIRRVGYSSLFTFIYSARMGTPAADFPDGTPHKLKAERLNRLIAVQDGITRDMLAKTIGQTKRVLVTEKLPDGNCAARLDDINEITLSGDCAVNSYVNCTITDIKKKRLYGKVN